MLDFFSAISRFFNSVSSLINQLFHFLFSASKAIVCIFNPSNFVSLPTPVVCMIFITLSFVLYYFARGSK